MRKTGFVSILLVVLFLLPVTSPNLGPTLTNESFPPLTQYDEGYSVSSDGDLSSGTGVPLNVNLNGLVSNVGTETMEINSGSSGTSWVTLEDGWTGSNLNAEVDSLTMVAEDTLKNGHFDDTHNERFIVTASTTENAASVLLPDGWTLVKDVPNDDPHPAYGVYRINSNSGGYGSTYGVRMVSSYGDAFNHVAGEEIYLSQMVLIPWREVYSVTISFRYYVESSSTLDDQVYLFTRVGGVTSPFHIFKSGDPTDSWLTASTTISASSMSDLDSYAILFDIGLTMDSSGTDGTKAARVRIDDLEADFTVRPFPEQVDLKANGTIVWGSTSGSVYPYVPDDANRDCYDTPNSGGLDLDGYSNDGGLGVGMYSTAYDMGSEFDAAFQFPVDIPQGAIITSAYFEAEAALGSASFMPGMRLSVADESNMTAFTAGGASLENRYSWLPTSIDWTVNSWVVSPTTRYRSPEMGPLVQKVVSNSNWVSGNYLCVMAELMYTSSYQNWNDLKGSSGYDGNSLARLFIEYVIPEDQDTVLFFNYQKDITIDHTKVAATLSDFPVMIDLIDTDLKTKVLSDGNDIAFTIGGQPVAHEIELFDQDYTGSEARLVAWVNVPTLSSTTDTVLTMHYGCENIPESYSGNVWGDYAIVQHLNNDPTGIQYDSTSNNRDGTSYGTMDSSDLVSGQIGTAISFDGVNDVISVGQIDTDDWTQFTMSVWFYHDISGDERVFSKSSTTDPQNHIITLRLDGGDIVNTRMKTDGIGGSGADAKSNLTAATGAWHYVSWSWSASRQSIIAYLDGAPVIDDYLGGTSVFDDSSVFVIGNNDLTNNRFWDGLIDEARLTTQVRSEAWVDTEYTNQNDPSNFYSVGSESVVADTWSDAGDTQIIFTTNSPTPITLKTYITMDISGEGQTLDENLDPGTSFFIETGSSIVNWTAKVMVSPPAGATSFGFTVDYPMAEWKPTAVLNPFNSPKTDPQDWWYQGGTLTINASSIDFWGIWTIKFISWNFVEDLTMGLSGGSLGTTAIYNIGDSMKFQATTPTVNGATVGFVLTNPSGAVVYTGANTTGTTPSHKFPSFEYRKDFTINPSVVYEDVTNFPIALDFTDTDLHNPAKVRSDGSDIMFAMGSTILPHEIEYFKQDYDIVNARLVAWVSANLSSSLTNTISMYYGSPIVDHLENPDGVWSTDYDAVWHLGEDVVDEGSGGIHYDSTSGHYNGIQYGNVETLTSKVGYAQSFDGNDYISITDTLTPPDDVMITGWFRISATHSASSANTQVLMEKYIDIDHDMVIALVGTDYGHSTVPTGSLVFKVESAPDSPVYTWTTRTTWNPGWYYIGCLADEDTPANNEIFVGYSTAGFDTNPAQSGSSSQANMSYVEEWQIGGGDYETSGVRQAFFTGQMDEWRVASTLQSEGWLQTEWRNQQSPSTFAQKGSEQARVGPDHTFTQALGTTAPAGVWTVSTYFNDTGTSVSTRTGLFERTFTVKRDSTLTLTKPTDAVGDRLSVKTAGDAIIVEFELEDTLNSQVIAGATVTMNWTTPSIVTLDDYGGGVYGKVLDTDDLADAKRWRVEVDSTHPYYNDDSEYFDIDLYHNSELDYSDVTTTPVNNDFTATVTFTDSYSGAPITDAIITFDDDSPVQSYNHEGSGVYSVTIDSAALALGNHMYTLKATSADTYLNTATVTITFNLRAHFTAMFASGSFLTPVGFGTDVTVILIDLDTGGTLSNSVVTSFTFTSSYGTQVEPATSDLNAVLNTNGWAVGIYTVNLTMIMSDSDYATPNQISFSVEIRKHYTALSVSGVVNQPYGNVTPLTLHLSDLDIGAPLTSSIVTNFNFAWTGDDYDHAGGGSLSFNLDTSLWSVGVETVTVTTTMSSANYFAPAAYDFDITIRSMTTVLYLGPSILNISLGSDFTVYLHLNVSEVGQYLSDPIIGRIAGEFSVPGYTIAIDTSQETNGIYKLTISETYFTGGNYQITVHFSSIDSKYANTFIVIQFSYREIDAYLSSPNYPQVVTPFQLDVEIVLIYADADTDLGISGATITSPDHPTWIANITDLTGGSYSVFIDVSSLSQGTHYISLTADKSGYGAKTLQFRVVIRAAYTSALPSVGSLDIPLGNSLFFYVDYTDIDRLLPIENSTTPSTLVTSTWGNFSVTYESGPQRYKITFMTSDSDTISQNIIYMFTFSKGANYQSASFNISVSIRTHNTDFRIVSSIEPTTTIGTFNISIYYGDLDGATGIKSLFVNFWVENVSGSVSSSYGYDLILGDGYYIIQVPASQFGLGLQTFTIYADWTPVVAKFQDKSLITTASVVGRVSALTLLIAAEPTSYQESMSYTFFFSDTGIGIDNDTGHVFITVSFQGQTVNPSDITIIDWSATQPGNYSVEFNTGIFSRIGLIYMDIAVEWAKGISPYYSNRTDTISVRVLQRDTLLQVSPPSPTSYGEVAAFNFTFDDVTSEPDVSLNDDIKLSIMMNVVFTYSETGGIFTIYVNTSQFAGTGPQTLLLSINWAGAPFYANRTGRSVYLSVINRETFVEYLTPAPTQYLDEVMFNVTWTDITGGANDPISGATLVLYDGASPVDGGKYSYFEIASGIYEFTLNTTYVTTPGTYSLRVELSIGATGIADVSITRQFNVRERITLLSAEPVALVPYNSSIIVVLYYQDLYTSGIIANDSADGYPTTLQIIGGDGSGWIYTASWRPGFGDYILTIETYNQPYILSTTYNLNLRMSYATQSPFYATDDLSIQFELRNRETSLRLTTESETTPYGDNTEFVVFFADTDAGEVGVASATITVLNNSIPLVENTHYTLTDINGFYTITIDSQYLGGLGIHTIMVQASWTGTPYYDLASRDVNILVRQRETNVEITEAPSQTRYRDNVIFTFVFSDLDAGSNINVISSSNVHLYFLGYTEIFGYTVNQVGASFEITVNSTILTSVPVSGMSIIVQVDWNAAVAPFYADDVTIMKVTITGRTFLVEIDQIPRTPKDDTMVVSVILTDMDNDNPVVGAIILFTCQNESLVEGVNYDRFVGGGVYRFDVYTNTITGIGILLFDIEVQWAPLLPPFYSNQSSITANGLVDYVRTSMQTSAPTPSTVQITDDLFFLVTYRDLDHNLPISGVAGTMNVVYDGSAVVPDSLSIVETGTPGVYNISFSSSDLSSTGIYTIAISNPSSKYAAITATPQFIVTVINTALVPVETSYQVDWQESAYIQVDFMDLLHIYNISGASIEWYLGETFGGFVPETGTPGRYQATIDTSNPLFGADTFVITISASASSYRDSLTTISLIVRSLPSDIIFITPTSGVQDVNRGNPVSIVIQLNDTVNDVLITDTNVIDVYISFESLSPIHLDWNGLLSGYEGVLPGSATILVPGAYDVRITATFDNYQPASEQFKILIRQTETSLTVIGPTEIDTVYSKLITFSLNLTEKANHTIVENAAVYWYEQSFNYLNLTFTFDDVSGLWNLTFNTTQGLYGTWGLTFRAFPDDPILASSTSTLTLTIKKIETEVIAPDTTEHYDWGWIGNISVYYNSTSFNSGISNATVTYDYGGQFGLQTYDLGNGTYLIEINTIILGSDTKQRITVFFTKPNYEERTRGIDIYIDSRPTVLEVISEEYNQIGGDATQLQIPMGDSFYVTFFYNDTSIIGGLSGGLSGATITSNTLFAGTGFGGQRNYTLEDLGGGYYQFLFDTYDSELYTYFNGTPQIGQRYFFTISLEFDHRDSQEVEVVINVIEIPTEYIIEHDLDLSLIHGDIVDFRIYVNDTWHNRPVLGAFISADANPALLINDNRSLDDGWYLVQFTANAVDGSGFIDITISLEYHKDILLRISVYSAPNDFDRMISQVTNIGLPISFIIILLLGLYVRVWSVPKRIRQINGQVKSLRKGKVPKPIPDVKSRSQLIADLFNDTYAKTNITRTAIQMPEESIPIDVPEMGELLIQLAILTNLNAGELEDFKSDISKMKISEQAAFVKEVITQEAIRAGRRDGKTVEEVIEDIEKRARQRLAGETGEDLDIPKLIETLKVETVFLDSEEPVVTEESKPEPTKETYEESPESRSDRMSTHEIEELRKELEKKGVLPHEIETIIEQARELPRELIEELVKSLDKDMK